MDNADEFDQEQHAAKTKISTDYLLNISLRLVVDLIMFSQLPENQLLSGQI